MKKVLTIAILLLSTVSFAQFPALDWVSQATGNESVFPVSSKVDSDGNIYSLGNFEGTADFEPGTGVTNLVSEGELDIFITKHNPQGNLDWALRIGDYSNDRGNSLALDANGNIYISGTFFSTVDFDPGAGEHNATGISFANFFVLKLSNNGEFDWVKTFSINNSTLVNKIATDNNGNVILAGYFEGSMTFATASGDTTLSSTNNGQEIFIMKMDTEGEYVWSQFLGSGDRDRANNVCTDNTGNIYVTGYFHRSVDFDFSPQESILTSYSFSNSDAFVLKLTAAGEFVWVKNMGGEFSDFGSVIAVDHQGNVFSGGSYQTIADMDPSESELLFTSTGSYDLYLHKLGPDGEFLWCGSIGGSQSDNLKDIAIDESGNVYFIGDFASTIDLNPNNENLPYLSNGADDIFITKVDNSGELIWAKTLGGSQTESGYAIQMGPNESVIFSGTFYGTCDFDPNVGTTTLTSAGYSDMFIAKYAQSPAGVEDIKTTTSIKVFPNPTNDLLNIQVEYLMDMTNLEIYSSTGQLVETAILSIGINTIDISNLVKGIYYLKVNSDSSRLVSHKFIKL